MFLLFSVDLVYNVKTTHSLEKENSLLGEEFEIYKYICSIIKKYMYSVIFSTIYIQILNELGISLTLNINFNNVSHAVFKQV